MGYYNRDDLPFQYALADSFTVLDNYFCSVMGPTHPNRYMWMTGTMDPNGQFGGPALDNSQLYGTYSWTSYADRLTAAGVPWFCYQETDSYGSNGFNVLQFLKQYYEAPESSPLYQNAMVSTPAGQFEWDALNDKLPAVSWVFPTLDVSEHPNAMPNAGAQYVASKLDAIAANPDVWAKTAVIISYDENDGLFDHVAPPVGPGYRVPAVIVSPWTLGGKVCSVAYDHTSQLRLAELVTGVSEPNIRAYRRQAFGDMSEAFGFGQGHQGFPSLPDTAGPMSLATYEASNLPLPSFPGGSQTFPVQEPGTRPHIG
jgi:phospholipase C